MSGQLGGWLTIEFVKRNYRSAYVYIAGSRVSRLIKVGLSTEVHNRLYIANLVGYANCFDWELLSRVHVQQAAKIESEVQLKLRPYQRLVTFVRSGTRQTARECFACSYQEAYSSLAATLLGFGILEGTRWRAEPHVLDNYEFDKVNVSSSLATQSGALQV
jgi:hypothetical protein